MSNLGYVETPRTAFLVFLFGGGGTNLVPMDKLLNFKLFKFFKFWNSSIGGVTEITNFCNQCL